jgi:hypothetical protein
MISSPGRVCVRSATYTREMREFNRGGYFLQMTNLYQMIFYDD